MEAKKNLLRIFNGPEFWTIGFPGGFAGLLSWFMGAHPEQDVFADPYSGPVLSLIFGVAASFTLVVLIFDAKIENMQKTRVAVLSFLSGLIWVSIIETGLASLTNSEAGIFSAGTSYFSDSENSIPTINANADVGVGEEIDKTVDQLINNISIQGRGNSELSEAEMREDIQDFLVLHNRILIKRPSARNLLTALNSNPAIRAPYLANRMGNDEFGLLIDLSMLDTLNLVHFDESLATLEGVSLNESGKTLASVIQQQQESQIEITQEESATSDSDLLINTPRRLALSGLEEQDFRFTIDSESEGLFRISTRAAGEEFSDLDTYLELYDGANNLIGDDDDGGDTFFSELTEFLPAGSYMVRIRGYGNDQFGLYMLELSNELPTSNLVVEDLVTTEITNFGVSLTSEFSSQNDYQEWFEFKILVNGTFDILTNILGSDIDTRITLYADMPDGVYEIGFNDDYDFTMASYLNEYLFSELGEGEERQDVTYYLHVEDKWGVGGNYSVMIRAQSIQ